jgi:hypothetical protein
MDVYAGRSQVNDISPSPYIGVKRTIGSNIYFEVNLFGMGYTAIEYVHVAGTGRRRPTMNADLSYNAWVNNSKDYTVEKSTMVPHLEFGFGFKF